MSVNKVEVLVSGHPRNAEKVFVTGTGRLREWFSYAATRGKRVINGRLRELAQLYIKIRNVKRVFGY